MLSRLFFSFQCSILLPMTWVIVGLGNPGEEYEGTRHNTGRMALEVFARIQHFSEWKEDAKAKATVSKGAVEKKLAALVLPDTFMNKSGLAVMKFVKSVKAAEKLVVVYDDLDLPLGTIKISFDRGSGGHRGVESIMTTLKTKKFTRIRIGVSPETPGGTLKKPHGEKEVIDFILKRFKDAEVPELKKAFKQSAKALEAIITSGPMVAMNEFN